MDAPTHLSHTPIVSWNDYDKKDGKFAGNTDAMALSIGFAQYADEIKDGKKDISLKVWRKPNERWSRQSEELPIHRNLDLTILLLSVLTGKINSDMTVDVEEGIAIIQDFCSDMNNAEAIQNRLEEIYALLQSYFSE